jgi:hypothetical protein
MQNSGDDLNRIVHADLWRFLRRSESSSTVSTATAPAAHAAITVRNSFDNAATLDPDSDEPIAPSTRNANTNAIATIDSSSGFNRSSCFNVAS